MYNKKSFNYQNVFRGIALMLSVLTLSFAVNYFAFAWTEPSVAPPSGNAPAPLNVSFSDQSKEGRIGIGGVFAPAYSLDIRDSIGLGTLRTTGGALLNTGGAATGLIVQNGNVGIGTTSPNGTFEARVKPYFRKETVIVNPVGLAACVCDVNNLIRDCIGRFSTSDPIGSECKDSWDKAGVPAWDKFKVEYDYFSVKGTGYVGIGTTDPKSNIHIRLQDVGASSFVRNHPGDIAPFTNNVIGGGLAIEGNDPALSLACKDGSLNCATVRFNQFNPDNTFRNVWAITSLAANSGDGMRITFGQDASYHHNDTLFSIIPQNPTAFPDNLGNVGINTRSPITALDVTGSFSSSIVNSTGYYGYKSGTTITRTSGVAFTAADVGRYFGWNNGKSDKIVAYIDANRVTTATSSTIGSLAIPSAGRISTVNFFINDTGDVGIGTDNPVSAKLYVMGDDGIVVDGEGSSAEIQFKVPSTGLNWRINTGDGEKLKFGYAGNSRRFTIDSNINVGIGTTSPSTLLEVFGDAPYSEILVSSPISASYGFKGGTMDMRFVAASGALGEKRFWIEANDNASVGRTWLYADLNAAGNNYNVGIGPWWNNLDDNYMLSVKGSAYIDSAFKLKPLTTFPADLPCNVANTGVMYYDDSSALCVCHGAAPYTKISGAGSCL